MEVIIMKKSILYIIFALVLVMLSGCEKEIKFKGEETESKAVMNSKALEGEGPIKVRMSYSRFFLSQEPLQYINDATVKLWSNGLLCGNGSSIGDGWYEIDYIPQCNDSLYMEAVTTKGEKLSAKTYVPKKVELSDIKLDEKIDEFSSGYYKEYEFILRFNLHDVAKENNYYQISLIMDREDETGESLGENVVWFKCDDPFITESNGNVFSSSDELTLLRFSDEAIDGKNYQVKLTGEFNLDASVYQYNQKYLLYVQVESLSKEEYLYKKTREQSYDNENNPFAEPVMIYSNVENGIGIFSASTIDRFLVKVFKD